MGVIKDLFSKKKKGETPINECATCLLYERCPKELIFSGVKEPVKISSCSKYTLDKNKV